MKLKKKLIVAATGVLCVFALAACTKKNEAVVSMKGEKITQADVYKESKASASSTFQQVIQQTVIYGAFSNVYGDKVTDKEVTAEYKKAAEQNGGTDSFNTVLTQYGYTEATYKKVLKQSLAFQAGLEAHVKLTDADLETAWKSYHPEVEAQIIVSSSEDDAKAALEAVKSGKDFGDVAKDQSTDTTTKEDGGTVKFDSTSTTIPADVQTAAFALKDGAVSDIVTVAGSYSSTYYIVKMTKNVDKGNSMDKYEKEVKAIATDTQKNDSTFQNKVIKTVLKKANVKILDDDLNQYFTEYLGTSSTSSSAAATSSSSAATATSSSAATTTSSSAATATSSSAATTTSSSAATTTSSSK